MTDATRKTGNKEQVPEIAVTGEKLDLRKKMGTITMVTPPSFFQNQNKSFCLINLSKKDKDNFADQINKYFPKEDLTIYLWDDNNFSEAIVDFWFKRFSRTDVLCPIEC